MVHYTAKANITRTIGQQVELKASEIQSTDPTDYLLGGSLVVRNGKIDKYLFDGGYAQATASGTTDKFTFYYQNKDHLGTVRETVTSTGAMKQRVNYYPFGGQLVDTLKAMVLSPNFQQYKYNGKEFDGTFGLNTYDYGARQHYPVLARWDRIDPLCEKYYGISPYAYCGNNPVKHIDPDGKEVIDKLPAKTKGEEVSKQKFFNQWHDKSNSIILMGHGVNNGKAFLTKDPFVIDAKSIYSMEYFLEDNSKTWNISSIASDKVELVLFSCETGSRDGLAENLSKQDAFQNVSIFAPTEPININPDGSVSIDNNGVWREYLNGEVINEYSGNIVPGTQEFDASTYINKTPPNHYWQR